MASTVGSGPDLDINSIDYDAVKDPGHGNTPAAWTGVFVMLAGGTVAAIGNVVGNDPVFIGGCAVAVVAGPAIGLIMRAMGKGKPRS